MENPKQQQEIRCPWCNSDEISARTLEKIAGCTSRDVCRCADCGRTFTINHDD